MSQTTPKIHPADLLGRYVRVYSAAVGCEDQVLAEGRVMWYQEAPTIGVEGPDGRQGAWSTRLRIEEIEAPPEKPDPTPKNARTEVEALFRHALRQPDPLAALMGLAYSVQDDVDVLDVSTHGDPGATMINRWLVVRIPRPGSIDRTVGP